jgi:mono/diheme cytochrome c family protein
MSVKLLSAALLVTGIAIGASAALAQDAAAPAGDAARGRTTYLGVGCQQCHGSVGQGGPGPILAKTLLPYEAFVEQVRNPIRNMPPYTDRVLSAGELADVYAYTQSLSGPPATLPALLKGR